MSWLMPSRSVLAVLLTISTLAAPAGVAGTIEARIGSLDVAQVADGFETPWSLAFLPGGGFLVTEREGRLWRVAEDGARQQIAGTPEVWARGQGGLLDVMVPRDFAESREVFLSFSKRQRGGAGTAVGVGRLNGAGDALEEFRVIFEMTPGGGRGQHFGSRIVEAPDGRLFVTIGERGAADLAQDLDRHNGSIVRLNRDGSVPKDNPFVGTDEAQPEIWSYGHRNPQGASLDGSGQLWAVEHGAQGGDEINRIEPGVNYGWPVISYGRHYDGSKIGVGTEKEGMAQPEFYWDPSIAPSGMAIYSGALWDDWRGAFIIGSLKFDYIAVVDPADWSEEELRSDETARVRDVREASDGSIWFISEVRGAIYRITPEQ